MTPRVLFISKPIAPPFHDGSKCLVRDVATHLTRASATVLTTPGAPELAAFPGSQRVHAATAYGASGAFTPAFSANLRAACWVLLRSRADVWHFVFAPNTRTSAAGRLMKRVRGVPVVQTVASPPRSFADPGSLFFGDVIVAQSAWTRAAIESSYAGSGLTAPRLTVIPPPVPELATPSASDVERVRRELGLTANQRYVLYPGDLETSSGGEVSAALAERLPSAVPNLVTVIAYRKKTPRAAQIAAGLVARLPKAHTRFVENTPDILALVAGAAALVFPVDDLWGKVDLPIVLLEAMALGVPVIVLDRGPLCDLQGVLKVPSLDVTAWLDVVRRLLGDAGQGARVVAEQRMALDERHRASVVARAYEDLYLELAH
ncbi:MAG: glycosyltransferase family 4 protein [Polyangiaceae bacterium]